MRNWIDRGELSAIRLGARRVRVRADDLQSYIAESSEAQRPDEAMARQEFDQAVDAYRAATDPDVLVAVLRRLSRASLTLARAVSRPAT